MSGAGRSRPARRATIVDVAREAGVSRQTVTRAINDMAGISPSTRDRVLAAAEELSYRPSRSGRALVRSEDPVMGLVVSDLGNAFFSELAAAMIREAGRRGWSVVFAESPGTRTSADVLRSLGERVDVLVGYAPLGSAEPSRPAVPVVLLDAPSDADPRSGRVVLDLDAALEELAEHLRSVGVRRPAVLDESTPPTSVSGRGRVLREALSVLVEGEVPIAAVDGSLDPEATAASREAALDRLLGRAGDPRPASGRPDAIVAFNDRLAVEALRSLRHRGLQVPQDVRVVGIDGLELGTLVTPSLTTLASDATEIARHAVELAVGIYERTLVTGAEETLRHHRYRLVVRESA